MLNDGNDNRRDGKSRRQQLVEHWKKLSIEDLCYVQDDVAAEIGTRPDNKSRRSLSESLSKLSSICHEASLAAGWYDELHKLGAVCDNGSFLDNIFVASRLCLIHSELSEALEGRRRDLMDDHLPQYSMIDVELADAIIKIMDLTGYLGTDIGDIVMAKLEYNRHRVDHKAKTRNKRI